MKILSPTSVGETSTLHRHSLLNVFSKKDHTQETGTGATWYYNQLIPGIDPPAASHHHCEEFLRGIQIIPQTVSWTN
jgi:hypothetical protein